MHELKFYPTLLVRRLLLIVIILTPVFGIMEIAGYLGIGSFSGFELIYLKAPKDILIITALSLSIISFGIIKRALWTYLFIVYFTIITLTTVFFSFERIDLLTLLSGLRWALPFLLTITLVNLIDRPFLTKVTNVLIVLLILNLVLQIIQMFVMPAFWGIGFFGLSGRVPGFFNQASISGAFTSLCFYFVLYFSNVKKVNKLIICSICILSIILSQSTLAFLLAVSLITIRIFFASKHRWILIVYLAPTIVLGLINVDTVIGRKKGASEDSFSTRIELFQREIKYPKILSDEFGNATNTAMNFQRKLNIYNNSYIPDSLFTSILTNYGIVMFSLFMAFTFLLLLSAINSQNEHFLALHVMFLLSSTSMITTEIFPGSLLYPMLYAYFISPK